MHGPDMDRIDLAIALPERPNPLPLPVRYSKFPGISTG
jgi:hypothetical protein